MGKMQNRNSAFRWRRPTRQIGHAAALFSAGALVACSDMEEFFSQGSDTIEDVLRPVAERVEETLKAPGVVRELREEVHSLKERQESIGKQVKSSQQEAREAARAAREQLEKAKQASREELRATIADEKAARNEALNAALNAALKSFKRQLEDQDKNWRKRQLETAKRAALNERRLRQRWHIEAQRSEKNNLEKLWLDLRRIPLLVVIAALLGAMAKACVRLLAYKSMTKSLQERGRSPDGGRREVRSPEDESKQPGS
jgi:hypothetical protein